MVRWVVRSSLNDKIIYQIYFHVLDIGVCVCHVFICPNGCSDYDFTLLLYVYICLTFKIIERSIYDCDISDIKNLLQVCSDKCIKI